MELHELAASKGMELQELAAKKQGIETVFKDLERRSLEEQDIEATGRRALSAYLQNLEDELDLASLEEDVKRRIVYNVCICSMYSAVGSGLSVAEAISP